MEIDGCSRADIRRTVLDIIEKVGLTAYKNRKVSRLSGGQKQRVAIARALAKDTRILVADEPTGNLDSESAQGIVELLTEIASDKLVIVVTHNFDQFEDHATRVIKMHDGKIVEDTRAAGASPAESQIRETASVRNNEQEDAGRHEAAARHARNIGISYGTQLKQCRRSAGTITSPTMIPRGSS